MESAQTSQQPMFWCHECRSVVSSHWNEQSQEMECTQCHGSFIEEIESEYGSEGRPEDFYRQNERSGISSATTASPAPGTPVIGTSTSNSTNVGRSQGSGTTSLPPIPGPLNPIIEALTSAVRGSQAGAPPVEVYFSDGSQVFGGDGSGADPGEVVRQIFGNTPLASLFQLPGGVSSNLGDYAFGNLNNIINQIMMNDPGQPGNPPAAKEVVASLPTVTINQEHVSQSQECPVCKDLFVAEENVRLLPCTHMFHPNCILPWLDKHNTCPVCRHELPTDDPDYENYRRTRDQRAQQNQEQPSSSA